MAVQTNEDEGMAALGELICRLNPYTRLPKDPTTGVKTGLMEVATVQQPNTSPARGSRTRDEPTGEAKLLHVIAGIEIEIEKNYGSKWTFKGQPQNVKAAFRIPYRFPVTDDDNNPLYWQTEYLLIGYAGGEGGA